MSHILTAIAKDLFLRRQENTEAAGELPERRRRPLTTVGDVHGGELPPLANCTLTLVTNSCVLGFFGGFCSFFVVVFVHVGSFFCFFVFFCATTKLCQLTAPHRYRPSALNGITSKPILLYRVSGYYRYPLFTMQLLVLFLFRNVNTDFLDRKKKNKINK